MTGAALLHGASILLLVVVLLAALSAILTTLRNGVPPMPTSRRVQNTLITLLKDLRLPEHAAVVELGSGWGNLSLVLSRVLPNATVTGYENSPLPFLISAAVQRVFRAGNLRLVRSDFHRVSLKEADLVVCYLSPNAMSRLQPKFIVELKDRAFVVSSTFALPEWKAARVERADDLYRTPVYVYLAGRCRSEASPRRVDISVPLSDPGRSGTGRSGTGPE